MLKKLLCSFTLVSVFAAPCAHAVYNSRLYLNDVSDYAVIRTSAWDVTEGNMTWQDTKTIHRKYDSIKEMGTERLLVVDFSDKNIAEAHATYSYYSLPDMTKQGDCTFEFRTVNYTWAPSFLNSHCTGPIHLDLKHRGGGIIEDYYTFSLS